jgi:hypothetical protein
MAGPELGNPALSFRGWYETLHGAAAFDALDRIPRLAWADYLDWFQQVTGTTVRYGTRLVEIEPQGDLLRLHLETGGVRRVETTRKLVLANGYAGAGGASVPDFVRALPASFWTHTTGAIPFETMAGKVVGVIGAGRTRSTWPPWRSRSGQCIFNRRSHIEYQGAATAASRPAARPRVRQHARAELRAPTSSAGAISRSASGVAPCCSPERAVAFKSFHIHLNSSLSDLALSGNGGDDRAGAGDSLDHLIAATGYRSISPPARARAHPGAHRWGTATGRTPAKKTRRAPRILSGPAFEFLPREGSGAEFLRNVHCFNLGGALSFGIPVGDVPSVVDQPRLVATIARDLYVEGVDVAAHERFINAPLAAPNPAPYERAVATREREVA